MSEENTIDPLAKLKIKHRALMFGAMSIIFMAIAILLYKGDFTFLTLPTVLTMNGEIVADSLMIAIIFGILSILHAVIGVIYSLMNKKIIGTLLSLIVLGGIGCVLNENKTTPEFFSQFKIEQRANVGKDVKIEVIEPKIEDSEMFEREEVNITVEDRDPAVEKAEDLADLVNSI